MKKIEKKYTAMVSIKNLLNGRYKKIIKVKGNTLKEIRDLVLEQLPYYYFYKLKHRIKVDIEGNLSYFERTIFMNNRIKKMWENKWLKKIP